MNSVAALLIFLLLRFPSPTSAHHIVFEEIGEMAGALSYIHMVVPVNISGLLKSIADFRSKIVVLKTNYADTAVYTKRLQEYGGINTNGLSKHLLFHFR
jgi:hypothetical protein